MTDNIDSIRKQVQNRVEKEAAHLPPSEDKKITSELLYDCLVGNELGDGILYATLFRDKYVYCNNSGEWYQWSGHYWQLDRMKRALADVEKIVDLYRGECRVISEQIVNMNGDDESAVSRLRKLQRDLLKRIRNLRTTNRRRACLEFAYSNVNPLAITGEEFDQKPMLFPCKNGVIDLETGKFKPGRPGDFLTKSSPITFMGIDEPAPLWNNTLLEIFAGNEDMVSYMRRLFGYAITGNVSEKIFPVLYGRTGWNGRSLIVEAISYVMGNFAGSIPAEMLISPRFVKTASSPSSDIMSLKGIRLAFASEVDENQRFSAAKIKWLTGNDELVGRRPYDKMETRFSPTHKLILMTNTQPQAPPNDQAFWNRIHLIPFNISFVKREPRERYERRAILDLNKQVREEASGILAWLVRGCLEWQRDGIKPPLEVTQSTEEYRRNEDLIGDFLDECCIKETLAREKASILYNRFIEWYHDNVGKNEPSGTWFGKQLHGKYTKVKIDGKVYYRDIRLKECGE
jgi:putative DNA primase/helicase